VQDVMMPDVDGIELLRFLRGNDAFAAVPVVSECLPASPLLASHYFRCDDCQPGLLAASTSSKCSRQAFSS
jgi:hypothetical protein